MTPEQIFQPIVSVIVQILSCWWWLILPIILHAVAKPLYLHWLWWQVWYSRFKWTLLEIIPPAETEKPFRAMEDIYTRLWPMYDGPNWREINCEGEFEMGFWFSFELVSIEGQIHFYIRVLHGFEKLVESSIQAHYPDAEIFEVEDYVHNVPDDIPNDKYQMYGEDYSYFGQDPVKGSFRPIKTYKEFEAAHPENLEGEQKIDTLYTLLEGMAKLTKGEQFWFQIVPVPIISEIPWVKNSKEEINKMARRPGKEKPKSITGEAARLLVLGKTPFEEEKEEQFVIPPEMKLTPGERESLARLEEKITKLGFKTYMRAIYIAERDKYFSPHGKLARGYMSHFTSPDGNLLMFWPKTRTRVHYFFRRRRLYKRKREILRKYRLRFPPKYPDLIKGTSVLNTEELATVFHLPTKASILPPGVPRVLAKKKESPPGIPFE